MGDTKIHWADKVWNPVTGCTKISPGCQNCYAEKMAKRLAGRYGYPADEPFRVTMHSDRLKEPGKWKKSKRIFVCSMGDLFHENVPFSWVDMIMKVAWDNRKHTFIILTKRPDRMLQYFSELSTPGTSSPAAARLLESRNYSQEHHGWHMRYLRRGHLQNLTIGVTAENQEQANKRIPILLQIPAAVRFVSVEPMLGPVDLESKVVQIVHEDNDGYGVEMIKGLDWVICGGESGQKARSMNPEWAESLHDQCKAAGVPFFMKQLSGRTKAEREAIPSHIDIQELPKA